MDKFTHLCNLCDIFDEEDVVEKANLIIEGFLKARLLRLSDIAQEMNAKEDWKYKCIQCFLQKAKPQKSPLRLFQEDASYRILFCNYQSNGSV